VAETHHILAKIIVRHEPVSMPMPCDGAKTCPALAMTKPHKNIEDNELNGSKQNVMFNIGNYYCDQPGETCYPCDNNTPEDKVCKTRFMINNIPFAENNVRKLKLGTASEWKLSTETAQHPFHIHVNPFQVDRKNPEGNMVPIWRDTLFVRTKDTTKNPVKIRSRYEVFIGKFVIHCHILDHEDQGMMQIVEIEN